MKIRLFSDYHAEFYRDDQERALHVLNTEKLPSLPGDSQMFLVMAGDICTAKNLPMTEAILKHMSARFKHVVYVAGNHEFYGSELLNAYLKIKDVCDNLPNVTFGGGRTKAHGVGITYCTLWTDFDKGDPSTMNLAHRSMPDYRLIKYGDKPLTPSNIAAIHHLQRDEILGKIREGDLVVTHHAPSFRSTHPDYAGDPLNGCFASELSELILDKKPALWIHGHSHHHQDYLIGSTRIVCNPVGYIGERDTAYKPDLVLEMP